MNESPLGKYTELVAAAVTLFLVAAAATSHIYMMVFDGVNATADNLTWIDGAALMAMGALFRTATTHDIVSVATKLSATNSKPEI